MKIRVIYAATASAMVFVSRIDSRAVVTEESLKLEADLHRLEKACRPNKVGGYNAPKMWIVNSIKDRIHEAFRRGVAVPRRGMLKSYWAELTA